MKFFGYWSFWFFALFGYKALSFNGSDSEQEALLIVAQAANPESPVFTIKAKSKIRPYNTAFHNTDKMNTAASHPFEAVAEQTLKRQITARKIHEKGSSLISEIIHFLFNIIPAKKSHYEYVQAIRHIKPPFQLKVKFPLPQPPQPTVGG